MGQIFGIDAWIVIVIIIVFIFIVAYIIFYAYYIRKSINESATIIKKFNLRNERKARHENENECNRASSSHSMVSADSTLPYRSSSTFSLHSRNDKNLTTTHTRKIRWIAISKIGSGGYSEVYHVIDRDSNKSLAMKWIRIDKKMAKLEASQLLLKTFDVESELLSKINHPNIIKYFGRSVAENEMNIFLELAPCGNLLKFISVFAANSIDSNQGLPEHLIRRFSIDVLNALSYLHSQRVVHRDLKCANLLVMNDGVIKVSDFGASCPLEETNSEKKLLHGTYNWMAPEMISATNGNLYNEKVDIWSFGCCLIEMSQGTLPWAETEKYGEILMYHIGTSSEIPKLPPTISQELNAFIMNHLQRNPKRRLSTMELLEHPFLSEHNGAEIMMHDEEKYLRECAVFKEVLSGLTDKIVRKHQEAVVDMFMYGLDHRTKCRLDDDDCQCSKF